MTSEQILRALAEQGHSYASIGRSLDPPVTRQSVRDVIVHGKLSARILVAVAEAIGQDPAKLFPDKADLIKAYLSDKPAPRSTPNSPDVQTPNGAAGRGARAKNGEPEDVGRTSEAGAGASDQEERAA